MLTYFGKWDYVESDVDYELARRLYVAPGEHDRIKALNYMYMYVKGVIALISGRVYM